MKRTFPIVAIIMASALPLLAQDHAASFDAQAAKATLAADVKKETGKFYPKGIDPVASRFYTKDVEIVTRSSGAKEEHPYATVPLLFQKNSDELLDAASRENVAKVAQLLKDIGTGTFAIEGHASAEGDTQRNTDLSKLRAVKVQELLRNAGVPESELGRVEGFGSQSAQFKDPRSASENQLQQDRRVLVVKER